LNLISGQFLYSTMKSL